MRSRLAFLSSGLTKATLSLSGKIPDVSDLFIISVSIVITDGRVSFSSMVGMGSKSQLLLGEVLIIFSTSSCDSGWKQSIEGGSWSLTSGTWGGLVMRSLSSDLIFDILDVKKMLKLSAYSLSECPGGSGRLVFHPKSELQIVNIFLEFGLASCRVFL